MITISSSEALVVFEEYKPMKALPPIGMSIDRQSYGSDFMDYFFPAITLKLRLLFITVFFEIVTTLLVTAPIIFIQWLRYDIPLQAF